MKALVQFSGGLGSYTAAKRAVERYGADEVELLFADTLIEDEDLYAFVDESVKRLGCKLSRISDGRTPWEVFRDVRMIGNTRMDPCSKILKRELCRKWILENCDESVVLVFGIDWTEIHRLESIAARWEPYQVWAPLTEKPYLSKQQMAEAAMQDGLDTPRLYRLGFPHNNCGGFCVKQGQAGFRLLLESFPERYAWHEQQEQEMRDYLDKDVAILRDRRGGQTRPMTLRQFRERLQQQPSLFDAHDWGGCGCGV